MKYFSTTSRHVERTPRRSRVNHSLIKKILINLIVFSSLIVALEYSYRVWLYFRNCEKICYNAELLTKLDAFFRTFSTVYGFLTPDSITGFAPADGTFIIREPGWDNATVTIRHGVRANPNFTPGSVEGAILAVGDSFVFGDQVSDDEAWPAILERRLNRPVVNGGVSGYGTAQAVLRAEQLYKQRPYSFVILSILIGADLVRDRTVNNINFYRPVVIRDDGRLRYTTIEESRKIVSKNFICAHRWIPELFFWSHIAKLYFSSLGYNGLCVGIRHPKAATEDEILEFAVARFATFPVNKAIVIQYPRGAFEDSNEAEASAKEARVILEVAKRHRVTVVDTYHALQLRPLTETYLYRNWWPHHSKRGNEIVADLIAREIHVLASASTVSRE